MHESVFVRRIRCPWLSYIRGVMPRVILDMYSLTYYAVPYTYIPLDSFAAQEINRRARATSNDRLCTRWMCASQIHICIYTYIYIHTRHWCMLKRDRSWYLFQLSVSCLPSPGYPTARVFQPKIHHVHTVFTAPANALIPTRPMQSRCPVWPTSIQSSNWSPETSMWSIRWLLSDPCLAPIELHSCGDCVTTLPLVRRKS